jgi:hypothetical protein
VANSEAPLVLLDELAYTAESDSVMLSALQQAEDTHFQHSQAVIVLCGHTCDPWKRYWRINPPFDTSVSSNA